MGDLDDLIELIDIEAQDEGPGAVEEVRALERHFELGAKLMRRRRELHFSQQRLAEITGIAQAEISRIERGMGNPTISTLGRIADALGARGIDFAWS